MTPQTVLLNWTHASHGPCLELVHLPHHLHPTLVTKSVSPFSFPVSSVINHELFNEYIKEGIKEAAVTHQLELTSLANLLNAKKHMHHMSAADALKIHSQ